MLAYENSGFSLDAKVKTESWDVAALERLIKYCARLPPPPIHGAPAPSADFTPGEARERKHPL